MYRKQHAKLRYEIFKVRVEHGKPQRGSVEDQKQREELTALIRRKPEFLRAVWEMYGVKQSDGDSREPTTVMKELYLDFLSKSLKETAEYNKLIAEKHPNASEEDIKTLKEEGSIPHVVVFSKRYATEQNQHNQILEQLITEDAEKFKKVYRSEKPITEGGNGLADIMLDPMQTYEKKLPTAQADHLLVKHHRPADFHFKARVPADETGEAPSYALVDQKTVREKKADGAAKDGDDEKDWEDVDAKAGGDGDGEELRTGKTAFHFK
jgi:hypothetical protein